MMRDILIGFIGRLIGVAPRGSATALAVFLLASTAGATQFFYDLHNHPYGGVRDPLYGLRLDELYNVTGGHDVFTFDFDHSSASMELVYNDANTAALGDDTVHISGTVFGGRDTGDTYGDANYRGLWEVDFTYRANIVSAGTGGDDIVVNPHSPLNNGTIRALDALNGSGGDPIALVDFHGDPSKGFSFKFNNTDDHRLGGSLSGPETFVGWGWLNHSDQPHIAASDWLFTANLSRVLPEPGTLCLLGAGLAGVGLALRRRRRSLPGGR